MLSLKWRCVEPHIFLDNALSDYQIFDKNNTFFTPKSLFYLKSSLPLHRQAAQPAPAELPQGWNIQQG